MKILIIGGAGYIGGVTAHIVEEVGHSVTAVDDLSSGKQENLPPTMKLVRGDITDKSFVDSIFTDAKFDVVMHFAAKILVSESMEMPYDYLHTNSFGVLNVADAAARHGVGAYILSSTAATYGAADAEVLQESMPTAPINPYGMSKLIAENILRSYELSKNLQWAALRFFNVAGAYKKVGPDYPFISHIIPMLLDRLRKGQPITIFGTDYDTPDGTCVRDYVHVIDIAKAHLLAAEKIINGTKINQPINLGSGSGFSVQEVVTKFQEVTKQPMEVHHADRRPGDPAKLIASNDLASEMLGWQPEHDLERIIRDHYEWYTSNDLRVHSIS